MTPTQLKQTNLIFAEHEFLLQKNEILSKRIDVLKNINKSWQCTDSINTINYNNNINSIKKKYKRTNLFRTVGEIIVIISLLILK